MTRYAHVGDVGKTAVQLIRGSKSSRNILVQTAETVWSSSRKHGGHVLGWNFSGHETAIRRNSYRNDQRVIKTCTLRRQVEEEQCDNEFAKSIIIGEPRQLFLGSTATTFLQQFRTEQERTWKKIRQMLVWDNRMKVLIHRKHEKFRCHQIDLLPQYVQIR